MEKEGVPSKFTHFILSVINEKFEKDIESESSVIGSLQLYGDMSTKFSESCQNAVIEADSQPKSEIQVTYFLIYFRKLNMRRIFKSLLTYVENCLSSNRSTCGVGWNFQERHFT